MKGSLFAATVLWAALMAAGCSSSTTKGKAREGQLCRIDSDCESGLTCLDTTCMKSNGNVCGHELCKPDEYCFEGGCVKVEFGDDRDGDGAIPPEDCNDFDKDVGPEAADLCDGLDNDCDGSTDEDCPRCADGASRGCGTDLGDCTLGSQECAGGAWGPCNGQAPAAEECDGNDNDCDGLTDEGCPCKEGDERGCSLDEGECVAGTQQCKDGKWPAECDGVLPAAELCNLKDDNCNGLYDEGLELGEPCEGKGECAEGVVECRDATSTLCSTEGGGSESEATKEKCNLKDDDCDGLTDEGTDAELCGSVAGGTYKCNPETGQCELKGCDAGYFDMDGRPENGCECKDDDLEAEGGDTCIGAKDLGGFLDDSAAKVTVTGKLVPEGDEDWFKFSGKDDVTADITSGCDNYHVRAVFIENPNIEFRFDVYKNGCLGANVSCNASADDFVVATDFLSWGPTDGDKLGECPCVADPRATPGQHNQCADNTADYYVKVYRPPGTPVTCTFYTIEISNGLY